MDRPPLETSPVKRAAILRAFVDDEGRLISLPKKMSKRLVVLDHIAGRFDPGLRYHEREVNQILGAVYPDYAALRRSLVDEGFMSRKHGYYWRTGGTVEV